MENTAIGDAATQARETSRKTTGRFGTQPHHDSGVVTVEPVSEQSLVTIPDDWQPDYSKWRHGGWYVHNARYLGGAVGCVSRNYPDRKWRIVCHRAAFEDQPTFTSRDEAARAEYLYTQTPSVIRAGIADCKKERAAYLKMGTAPTDIVVAQYDPRIAGGEKLLTDNGLLLEA